MRLGRKTPFDVEDRKTRKMMSEQTILIVDDDPQIRDVLNMALTRAGYRTVSAKDGADGLKQALLVESLL